MQAYIVRRLLLLVFVVLGVTFITFSITTFLPGDPALAQAGRYATAEQIAAVRERLGLDRPLHEQYLRYLGRLARGDLGQSIETRKPVLEDLLYYAPASAELILSAMLLTILIGIPLGVIAAVSKNSWIDSTSRLVAVVGAGMPAFWLALILQLVLYGWLDLVPLGGRLSVGIAPPPRVTGLYTVDSLLAGQWTTYRDALAHLVLPAFTLAVTRIAVISRMTRSSMLEVLSQDYVRTARSKGLRMQAVVYRHALRNALLPIITMLGMQVGWLISGTLLVEIVFAWGGLGTYAWTGILALDLPIIMGVTVLAALVFVLLNLLVDVTYTLLDPRITY